MGIGGFVFKRTTCIGLFLGLTVCWGSSATAQSVPPNASCLALTDWWPFPDGYPPGWFYYAPYPGTYVVTIASYKASCPHVPCVQCSKGAPSVSGGRPIYLTSGDTYVEDQDVSLPGLGRGLSLIRRWDSMWPSAQISSSIGMFGPNWRSTYEERIFMGGDNWLTYARGNGGYWAFGLAATGGMGTFSLAAPSNVSATLVANIGASDWVVTFQDGEKRHFNPATGLLTSIVDRNGNTTQLTYDGTGRLTTVTDPAGRHLYFQYGTGASANLVTGVTSDFGVSLSYSYDANGRLAQVTKPDLTTITYTYNSASQITQVTDSNGKILESHTYDSKGRGLTSSRANGVEALTLTYPQ